MLGCNEDVLSIFEFFTGLDWGRRFQSAPMSGAEFTDLITAEQPVTTAVLKRGYEVEEIVYPFGEDRRYRRGDPVPWLLVTMMPRLSDDPDELFDEVSAFAKTLPNQPPAEHYRALFEWLTATLGKRHWIERSGSSVEYLEGIRPLFPDARYLHLHRDGREVALSMLNHDAYRLPIALLYDAPTDAGVRPSEMDAVDVACEPTDDDPISQILASRPPAEYFGRYWTDQVVRGFRALGDLDADQYLQIGFEELVSDSRATLERIAAFFELDAGSWLDDAAALVRGVPATRYETLAPTERERLDEACRAGARLLGREH